MVSRDRVERIAGLRVAGLNASRPLARVFVSDSAITVGPRWKWLGIVIPTLRFEWQDVAVLIELVGIGGTCRGLRFVLGSSPVVSGGLWLVPWTRLARKPIVWLTRVNANEVLAIAPATVPRQRRRGLIVFP